MLVARGPWWSNTTMKFSVTLFENGEREKLILESGTDLPKHIALKILAYVLYRGKTSGQALEIERRVGQRHKPDLVAIEPETGRVSLWIDCGQIETDRLARIVAKNPTAAVVVVKGKAREAERYAQAAAKDLKATATILGFDDGFIEAFVDSLRGTNTLEIERDHGTLLVGLNGQSLRSEITTFVVASIGAG